MRVTAVSARLAQMVCALALAACDGRPLLYQLAPSETDLELLAAYQAIDAAGTGQLARADCDTYFKRRFAELDRNHDGFLDDGEAQGMVPIFGMKSGSALVFHLDLNGDGKLSQDEFLRLSNYLFTRDENRDGILTLKEVKSPPTDTAVAATNNKPGLEVGTPTNGSRP